MVKRYAELSCNGLEIKIKNLVITNWTRAGKGQGVITTSCM